MAAREPWYHETTKKVILAFATIFDEIDILDDFGRKIRVPLQFSQKEKFLDDIARGVEFDQDSTSYDVILPRIGFELTGMNFSPERHTNPINTITATKDTGEEIMMYNRVPYDLSFDLFVVARKLEDALKIVERIIPFFNPGLTLTVKDMSDFEDKTNITFTHNSVAMEVGYEGSMDTRRTIMFTLNFTAKAYYYLDVKEATQIKQTILEFKGKDLNNLMARYTSTVTPMSANRDDPHTVVDTEETFEIT